jgi:hypothetical protein
MIDSPTASRFLVRRGSLQRTWMIWDRQIRGPAKLGRGRLAIALTEERAQELVEQLRVRFADGRPSRYFYNIAGRRLSPDAVDGQTALERARAVARAEQDKRARSNYRLKSSDASSTRVGQQKPRPGGISRAGL